MQAENPGFFYATEGDSEHCGNVFWTDATSRANYSYFGDTVRVDTSYRTNRSKIPFITFTGINHHAQPVLFGCALLLNESDNSFIWLLQTWLQAMSGRSPVSITCDPDRLIQMAVAQVLPEARSRFCRWSIFRQTQEKLSNSLYNIRDQWVPIYLRDVFFGELSTVEHNDALSLFFDGLLSTSTTIQLLIKQYEKTISSWHEKELKDDFDSSNTTPVLKTPSPMEKQAANLYTRRIFMKFQGELVETLANPATIVDDSGTIITYRVAKFGEEHKAHTVRFNAFEMKATCSCRMFEFSGIICRHVLSVFRAKNVLMLPPEYVLKRWTRNAKTGVGESEPDSAFGLPSNSQDSPIVRHNNLRQEAVKYVEEGAKSIHVYNVAMSALQEASKRVSAAKCKNSGTTLGTSEANGGNLEMHAVENQSASCLSRVRYFKLSVFLYIERLLIFLIQENRYVELFTLQR
ncbi:UNVERIFIED_CONTAM: protein FAR1-RELATED SEQUENCE 9, partial [Sesamum calycinum]